METIENRDFGSHRVKPTELQVAEHMRRIQLEIAKRHRDCGEHYAARIAAGYASHYTRKIKQLKGE